MSKTGFNKASPVVLGLLAVAGVVGTAVTAVKATPKALRLIEAEKQKQDVEELPPKEVVKVTWKCYVPAAVLAASTALCILSAGVLNRRQHAALTGAYALAENSYRRYRQKVKEICGEDAHKKVTEAMVKEECSETHITTPVMTGTATLDFDESAQPDEMRTFYDIYSDRYFEATIAKVIEAEYHLNRNYALISEVTLNNFYEFLGLADTIDGDKIGWATSGGLGWIDFDHRLITLDDGMEIFEIDFVFPPSELDDTT